MGRQVDSRQFEHSRRALRQYAASCELALKEYLSRFSFSTEQELFRALIPAIATVRTAAELLDDERSRQPALRLAEAECSHAANESSRYGFDEPLLRCAVICDQALAEIELLLTSLIHN